MSGVVIHLPHVTRMDDLLGSWGCKVTTCFRNDRARVGALPCSDTVPPSTILLLLSHTHCTCLPSSLRNATFSGKPPLSRSSLAIASPSRLQPHSLTNPGCSPIISECIVTLVGIWCLSPWIFSSVMTETDLTHLLFYASHASSRKSWAQRGTQCLLRKLVKLDELPCKLPADTSLSLFCLLVHLFILLYFPLALEKLPAGNIIVRK